MLPSHPLIPADGLQFASVAHAVSQADETPSKALVESRPQLMPLQLLLPGGNTGTAGG